MADSLQNATNGYQTALRWGYYENAYAYIDPKQRRDQSLPAVLEGLRLTGYDVIQSPTLREGDDKAIQIVEIEYLHVDRQVVKKLKDRQVWRYDADKKTWWLTSGLPAFKTP